MKKDLRQSRFLFSPLLFVFIYQLGACSVSTESVIRSATSEYNYDLQQDSVQKRYCVHLNSIFREYGRVVFILI